MTEVLLKELSNDDIDWMLTTGSRAEIAAGTTLICQGEPVKALYLLLEGSLTVTACPPNDNPVSRAFAALEGGELSGREIARLSNGELVGELSFMDSYLAPATVKALKTSVILTIPQSQLLKKLQQDSSFAAHYYRAIGILLADRLERIVRQVGYSTTVLCQPQLREILFIFSELHDSDIGWMIAAGRAVRIPAGTVLIQGNRPVEALYILMDGRMVAAVEENIGNPLARAFSTLEQRSSTSLEREFARLSQGDIVGENPFLEVAPPAVTIRAVEDSLVLTIPRSRLAAKLLEDEGFASRFYRVLAILLADKQQGVISRLGYGRLTYSKGQSLDDGLTYQDELSSGFLAQVTLAGTKFDWMLKQIRGN